MKNNTIIDIAKKLGISASTVSRALNDNPAINIETKRKVKEYARELNYVPNPIAKNLKSNKSTTIGVIVPEIRHDFFSSAISGIEEVAYQMGYNIILCQSNEDYQREVINTDVLINHRVAGIIVSISQNTHNESHFQKVIDRNIPIVFFDRTCNTIDACKVIIDDKQTAYNAVEYLIQRGYKKIAHFAGPENLLISQYRLSGYKEMLKKAKIKIDKNLIIHGGFHETDGYKSMESLLNKGIKPDAVFAVNDPVAIGAFQKIKEAGLKIPDDIALIGFSNNKITSLVEPAITTISQPSFEMGKKAVELLIENIKYGNKHKNKTIILPTELIIRKST